MSRARFTGRPYITRKAVYYAHPSKWWIRTDWSGWWEVRPPVTHSRIPVKRFAPNAYWTQVVPYVRALLTEKDTANGHQEPGHGGSTEHTRSDPASTASGCCDSCEAVATQ